MTLCSGMPVQRRMRLALGIVLCLCLGPQPVQAQFSAVQAPGQAAVHQVVNLFATWEGREAVDGLLLDLPAGWTLQHAVALRFGREVVPLVVRRGTIATRHVAAAAQALQGPHELVFRVHVGPGAGREAWALMPFTLRQDRLEPHTTDQVRRTIHVYTETSAANYVLAFEGKGPPLLLRRRALPEINTQAAFTVAGWLQTTSLDEVVLSTWTGDEQEAYPLEIVVDGGGHLAVYRGRPGRHEAVRTPQPVADGTWHHVAVAYGTGRGDDAALQLVLDGMPVDSLEGGAVYPTDGVQPLAIGGRVPAVKDEAEPAGFSFTGRLDDLAFWPEQLSAEAVRRHLQRRTASPPPSVQLDFEEELPEALVERRPARLQRSRGHLHHEDHGLLDLRAHMQPDAVQLIWSLPSDSDADCLVERSTDGQTFEVVGRLAAGAAELDADGTAHFRYTDQEAPGQVLFYRVQQSRADGTRRQSSTIKVGLGAERTQEVTLLGNFPNPFSTSTTITYELPQAEQVHLSVWDLSGHQVVSLVDEVQPAGAHEVRFQAGDLPSGTYFVRLQTPSKDASHKMILMK